MLPTRSNPTKAVRIGPKILILYSLPKVGKTEALVELAQMEDTLIIDAEQPHGTDTYETTSIKVDDMQQALYVAKLIDKEGVERTKAGKKGMDVFPYKFVAIDTLDAIEDYAEPWATKNYKESTIGKSFQGKSVLELPNGGGYYYLRNAVTDYIDMFASRCPYLILIVHVKEKNIATKDGMDVKVNDISLMGKLSSIVCAKADAIGYMYRDPKGQKMVSFQTYDGAVMGARQKYLAGKAMPFAWQTIYPDVFGEPQTQPSLNGQLAAAH
jgi:hypothetical protein